MAGVADVADVVDVVVDVAGGVVGVAGLVDCCWCCCWWLLAVLFVCLFLSVIDWLLLAAVFLLMEFVFLFLDVQYQKCIRI